MKCLFKLLYFTFILSNFGTQAYNSPKYTHDLARDNFKLVPYFAKSFIKKHKLNQYQCQELIQEGSIGLIYACRKYDDTYKIKFSTYSSYWIRSYMSRYIKNMYSKYTPFCLDETRYVEVEPTLHSVLDIDGLEYAERYFIQKKYFERMTVKELAIYLKVPEHFVIRYNKRLLFKLKTLKPKII